MGICHNRTDAVLIVEGIADQRIQYVLPCFQRLSAAVGYIEFRCAVNNIRCCNIDLIFQHLDLSIQLIQTSLAVFILDPCCFKLLLQFSCPRLVVSRLDQIFPLFLELCPAALQCLNIRNVSHQFILKMYDLQIQITALSACFQYFGIIDLNICIHHHRRRLEIKQRFLCPFDLFCRIIDLINKNCDFDFFQTLFLFTVNFCFSGSPFQR